MLKRIIQYFLRSYQAKINNGINEIYDSQEDFNRYAASGVATGGGKSFIALSQMMSFGKSVKPDGNGEVQNIEIDENGVINNAKMVYLAPTNEILNQVKRHIVKNVLLAIPDIDKMSVQEIDDYVKAYVDSDFSGINTILQENGFSESLSDDASAEKKKRVLMKCFSMKQIDDLVKKTFPNLKFGCYGGIKEKVEGTTEGTIAAKYIEEADFVILDEAHRIGAASWGTNFFRTLRKNDKAKVLAITATPDRKDDIERDMFSEIANQIYEQTVLQENYLVGDIFVLDAMRDGLVVSPDLSQTDIGMIYSPEFKRYITLLAGLERQNKITPEVEQGIVEVETILGIKPGSIRGVIIPQELKSKKKNKNKEIEENNNDNDNNQEQDEIQAVNDPKDKLGISKKMSKFVGESIQNPNGKYIAFIPSTPSGKTTEEHFREWMEKIKNDLSNVKDKNGKRVNVTFSFVTSIGNVGIDQQGNPVSWNDKHDEGTVKINSSQIIKDFEDASNETGGIKVLVSMNLLNEGVHVEGIDGAIMYRSSISPTLFLQQFGRAVSSMNPSKPISKHQKTQIIDAVGNTFKQTAKGLGGKKSVHYDLERVKEIKAWIETNQRIPDINAVANIDGITDEYEIDKLKAKAEYEARIAMSIKRIQTRYRHYYSTNSLPLRDSLLVKKLLELSSKPITIGKENVDFWNVEIPQRTMQPSERDLTGAGFLEHSDGQKRFLEIYNQLNQENSRISKAERLNKLFRIVKVLKDYKPDVEFPQGIFIGGLNVKSKNNDEIIRTFSSEEVDPQKPISMSLKDFLKKNHFDEKTISLILTELAGKDIPVAHDSELLHVGEEENYDLGKELAFVRGLIYTSQYENRVNGFGKDKTFDAYSLSDFIRTGIIKDGQKDMELLSEMNFKFGRKYQETGTNPNYQNRLDHAGRLPIGLMTDKNNDLHLGMLTKFADCSLISGERYDENNFDVYGFNRRGFDKNGFDKFGYNENGKHRITGTIYDQRGFYYDEKSAKYLNRLTGNEYDALGYNIYGFNDLGFSRSKGLVHHYRNAKGQVIEEILTADNSAGAASFDKPMWHHRLPDGSYDLQHGYIYRTGRDNESGLKQVDGLGFKSQVEHSTPDKRFRQSKNMKDNTASVFFNSDGAKSSAPKNFRGFNDFFIDGEDALGFNRYGYKRVCLDGEHEVFIHRDTSSFHDQYGRMYDPEKKQAVLDPAISSAQSIIAKIFKEGKANFSEHDKRLLSKAFKIYSMESPEAFGNSYEQLLEIAATTEEGKERIETFFSVCPLAREVACDKALVKVGQVSHLEEFVRESMKNKPHEKNISNPNDQDGREDDD